MLLRASAAAVILAFAALQVVLVYRPIWRRSSGGVPSRRWVAMVWFLVLVEVNLAVYVLTKA